VAAFGLDGAVARLRQLSEAAVAAIPCCPGQAMLRALMLQEAHRLVPRKLVAAE
jgi:geranylgeranyl diphosphate synthase type II